MRRSAVVGWAMMALVGACEVPRTEIVVRVDSEVGWGPGQRVQSVVLSVRRGGADGPLRSARTTELGAGADRLPLPLYVGVLASDGDTDTPVWVEALGCGDPNGCTASTAAVAQRAIVRFARGQTQELPLLLASACLGVTCASDQRCDPGAGSCRPANAATTRPFLGYIEPTSLDAARDAAADDIPADSAGDATGSEIDTPAGDTILADVRPFDGQALADREGPPDVPGDIVTQVGSDLGGEPDRVAGCTGDQTPCGGGCVNRQSDSANCGACGRSCTATQTCVGGTCADGPAPRAVAPLSTSTATSRRPTFRWVLPAWADGARVEWCRDRACTDVAVTADMTGSSGRPERDLPSGVLFWRLRGRRGSALGSEYSATWQVHVGPRSAPIDTTFGTILDVNADGYADVAVGAPEADPGGRRGAGTVSVFLGGPTGLGAASARVLEGVALADQFGLSVASAGDVNGDGYADLAVGAPFADPPAGRDAGAVSVFLGGPSGVGSTPSHVFVGGALSELLGTSIAGAGDVNGDGYADLAVGAPLADPGERSQAGMVRVFFGGPAGLNLAPGLVLAGAVRGDRFGSSIGGGGDVNGDGYADLVVGSPLADPGGRNGAGAVSVHLGGPLGIAAEPGRLLAGASDLEQFGSSVALAADVSGDGCADLVVGSPFSDPGGRSSAGMAHVFLGGATGIGPTPVWVLEGVAPVDQLGTSVASAGDVDGDGYGDFVIGTPLADPGGRSGAGSTTVVLGGPAAPSATSLRVLEGATPTDQFGAAVAGAGDVNNDGYSDVIVGAPLADPGGRSGAGTVSVFLGSLTGLGGAPARVIEGGSVAEQFGQSVASGDRSLGGEAGSAWGVSRLLLRGAERTAGPRPLWDHTRRTASGSEPPWGASVRRRSPRGAQPRRGLVVRIVRVPSGVARGRFPHT